MTSDQTLLDEVSSRFPDHSISFHTVVHPDLIGVSCAISVDGESIGLSISPDLVQTIRERHGVEAGSEVLALVCEKIKWHLLKKNENISPAKL